MTSSGFLYWPWVISYSCAGAFFFLAYLKFLRGLPRKTMTLFIVSGLIYVAGAIGFEIFGAREAYLHNADTLRRHQNCILIHHEQLL